MLLSNIVKRIKMALTSETVKKEKGKSTPVPRKKKNVGGFVWVPNKIRKRMGRL